MLVGSPLGMETLKYWYFGEFFPGLISFKGGGEYSSLTHETLGAQRRKGTGGFDCFVC